MNDKTPQPVINAITDVVTPMVESILHDGDPGVTVVAHQNGIKLSVPDENGPRGLRLVATLENHTQVDALILRLEKARRDLFPDAPPRISGFVIGEGT